MDNELKLYHYQAFVEICDKIMGSYYDGYIVGKNKKEALKQARKELNNDNSVWEIVKLRLDKVEVPRYKILIKSLEKRISS